MDLANNIFGKHIRQDKNNWGLYVALIWAFFISMGIIDSRINSPEAGPTSPTVLFTFLGLVVLMTVLFIYKSTMGWCLITAVHMIQAGNSVFGIFGVLSDATLDGAHIIGMARSGVGTSLGIIMVVYLFQPFIREIYSASGSKANKGTK